MNNFFDTKKNYQNKKHQKIYLLIRMVCRRDLHDIYYRWNRPHANVSLYKIDPYSPMWTLHQDKQ